MRLMTPRGSLLLLLCAMLGLLLAGRALAGGPEIQHWTTDDGLDVYYVQTDILPLVDMSLMFDAGSARDGDLPGLAALTSNLLGEGADGLDAGEVARLFEDQGARFSTSSGRDYASVELRSLSDGDTLDAALDTLTRVVAKPDFDADVLDRQRRRMLVALENAERNPGAVAGREFWKAAYGDHPYASDPGGTEDSLEAIERDHVVDFHRQHYVRENATLAVVGDLDRERVERLAETLSGALRSGEKPEAIPEPSLPDEARTIRIPFQTSQTHIIMGHPAYARGDEAHFPLYVGNHVLGGSGLVSRLAIEMREERGLSYGVSSSFLPMQTRGPFRVSTRVRTDRTDEALEVLREELRSIREDGPGDDELEDARRNITGSFPLNLDSNAKIAGYVASIGFHGMPLDYLDTFIDQVEAVDRNSIVRHFREQVDPDRMITIILGPEADEDED
ncbi:insulinase family protein [Methylonatrum kenyense]|uniref:M16 family metallopeptidase n=1 Tax=Methylonatrum kenyense TaxID=455253 RepID=UPI0020C0C356|nr:pitrilysin family protein [Methylonatrum kenyense]MCK8515493.1 insulinase family protein [Methylonatrum kenyense]